MSRYLDIPASKTLTMDGGFDNLESFIGKQVIANILEYDDKFSIYVVRDKKIVGTLCKKNEKSSKRYSRIINNNYWVNGMVYTINSEGKHIILDEKHKRSFPNGFYSIDRDNFYLRGIRVVEE
ncbi:MAG: hypothetical protein WC867_08170 [Candidatus Pacearchaeota archaeon]|jgi:hypothetical protein